MPGVLDVVRIPSGIAILAGAASNSSAVPPGTGQRTTAATSMSGSRTSIPKTPVPSIFSRASSRGTGFPMTLKSPVRSGGLRGGSDRAASSASSPYVARFPVAAWVTAPADATQSATGTPQRRDAAPRSISRAVAPA
jgi:hypothetical protein